MLNRLKNKNIFKNNKVLGVHCYIQPDGNRTYQYVLLSRKQGNVEIEQVGTLDENLELLFENFTASIPICLSIDGKGILSKKILPDPSKSVIHQVIPNTSEDDFYLESTEGVDHHLFISLARKDMVLEIVRMFTDQKRFVIELMLGPFKASKLISLFPQLLSPLMVPPYQMDIDADSSAIIDYIRMEDLESLKKETYLIGTTDLSCEYVLAYYNALSYYLNYGIENGFDEISEQNNEYASKRMFITSGVGALLFIFILLLGNLMLYFNFSEHKQQLESKIAGNEELLVTLKKLKDELTWKEKFLSQAGILRNSRLSYFADKIASTVPVGISLDKMELHPILTKVKKQKEIELQPDQIIIEGLTKESSVLNEWTRNLKKFEWAKDVTVVNYLQDTNATTGSFTVDIRLRN